MQKCKNACLLPQIDVSICLELMVYCAGATYLCNSKLCSFLEQRHRLESMDSAPPEPGPLYLSRLDVPGSMHSMKRAPGMEFLGKRSSNQNFGIPQVNKRAPGKSS